MARIGLTIEQVRSLLELSSRMARAAPDLRSQLEQLGRDLCQIVSACGSYAWSTENGCRDASCVTQNGDIAVPVGELLRVIAPLNPTDQVGTATFRGDDVEVLERTSDVASRIVFSFRREQDRTIGIALLRPTTQKPFSQSELLAVDLVVSSGWLPADRRDSRCTSSRQRELLALLKAGCSEKEAAQKLNISVHTIHVYTKQIYRLFNVSSRGELLSLWIM